MNNFIIAIDGPAAAGKGTLARNLAAYYDFNYLDTGLSYRAIAYASIKNNIRNEQELLNLAANINLNKFNKVFLYSAQISDVASKIATNEKLRAILVKKQRDFAHNSKKGAVLDGRDIATIVCPNAQIKLYIEADLEIRAARRLPLLKEKQPNITKDEVLKQLAQRDERDKNRTSGALLKAADAYVINTSHLTIEEALAKAKTIITPRLKTFLALAGETKKL